MISYEKFLETDASIQAILDKLQAEFNQYPRGAMGLTPDHIKASPAWQKTNREWNKWFKISREFNRQNKTHCKHRATLKRAARMGAKA